MSSIFGVSLFPVALAERAGPAHWLDLLGSVRAGFPSPAEDLGAKRVDLTAQLVKHPQANDRFGKGALKIGSSRIGESPRGWTAKQERRTPAYTTDWLSLPVARA